jgi:hypothetical protein
MIPIIFHGRNSARYSIDGIMTYAKMLSAVKDKPLIWSAFGIL